MFDRSFRPMCIGWDHKIPSAIIGMLVLLALLIWGTEARATDEHSVSAISASSFALDLSIPIEPSGESSAAVEKEAPRSARVTRIASCHQASVGRYYSEERGAFSNALAEASEFEAAVVHFVARRESRTQFDSCSSH